MGGFWAWTGVVGIGSVLGMLAWLQLSGHPIGQRWRALGDNPEPHLHVVDQVTFMHTHARGAKAHTHAVLPIPATDYARLLRNS